MAPNKAEQRPNPQRRTKVKTGCATCRIRKIKCDEGRPSCRKCVTTGRTCDGYDSQFRAYTGQPVKPADTYRDKAGYGSESSWPAVAEIAPRDVELLNRCFSTKTLLDVDLDCDEEARLVLQASLTDPSIRHAVSSLKALREHLDNSRDPTSSAGPNMSSCDYGLQQYCLALKGLASNLCSPASDGLKSALFCCQIFISIEQVRVNYPAMAQHISQGLRVMREHHARPALVAASTLVPAHHDQLPMLDVFIIKLFAAPCKFSEAPTSTDDNEKSRSSCPFRPREHSYVRSAPVIAPNIRTRLVEIGTSTIEFLGRVSRINSAEDALSLLPEKASLLYSLDSWLVDVDHSRKLLDDQSPEPIKASFLRLFYHVLKIVLLGTLDSSFESSLQLRKENDRLQVAAVYVDRRLGDYKIDNGSKEDVKTK
jgi:hypothetical protein